MLEKICPYPGLRPFNEEESIFFRGREEHIEKIISQLEEKKFVMLTGASGDGKSSLVYAGVIPNARAGFFKAKFNNWLIVDFRPERNPLKNMAAALAGKLNYTVEEVEKELNFGFSSLVKLYKNSFFHLDYTSEKYSSAEETEKKKLKRKASNLFILVDQFEEFFTNPENYKDGKASNEAQLVVNLLLETAKIALAEDLPIYIVCTMRSDYIGQCAAFRGLPEFIGFSQFFVPRLKRKEIHQVINEPALLSGNSISNRLVETLINQIGDGFDQLPVLQHALNRIWNKTNKGEYEMDLLHLAMIGGMDPSHLPDKDKQIFSEWITQVEENKKLFFNKATLDAVLNAHAYELFETANEYYNQNNSQKIEKTEAQFIIKTAFQCLTKIDEARAVRNRMSLQEIVDIINNPGISLHKVEGVLRIFRLQGNTFIKPFVPADITGVTTIEPLPPETVLDITHESLIRNWDLLEQWAKEEHENWLTFQDFNKQLQRWLNHDKDSGFLLPIGALNFFEQWYKSCKPNKYWLARYDESNFGQQEKLKKAEETLSHAKEFIAVSARRLFFSRTVMKIGAGKLLAALGILFLLIACTYYYFDFQKKQNAQVIENVIEEGIKLLRSPDVSNTYKADFLINYERLREAKNIANLESYNELLNQLNNDSIIFDIEYAMLDKCRSIKKSDSLPYDVQGKLSLSIFNSLYDLFKRDIRKQQSLFQSNKSKSVNFIRINQYLMMVANMKNIYSHTSTYQKIDSVTVKSIDLTKSFIIAAIRKLEENSGMKINLIHLNNCIVILLSIDDTPEYQELISIYENTKDSANQLSASYVNLKNYSLGGEEIGNGFNEILSMLYTTELDSNPAALIFILKQVEKNFMRYGKYTSDNILYAALRHCKNQIKLSTILDSIETYWLKKSTILDYSNLTPFKNIASINLICNNYLFHKHFTLQKNFNPCLYFISETNQEFLFGRQIGALLKSKNRYVPIENALALSYNNYSDSIKLSLANYFKCIGNYFFEIRKEPKKATRFYSKMKECIEHVSKEYISSVTMTTEIFNVEPPENYIYIYYPKLFWQAYYHQQFNGFEGTSPADFDAEKISRMADSQGFLYFVAGLKKIYNSVEFEKTILFYLNYSDKIGWRKFYNLINKYEKNNLYNISRTTVNSTIYSDTTSNVYHYVALPLMRMLLELDSGNIKSAKKYYLESIQFMDEHLTTDPLIKKLIKEASISFAKNSGLKESLGILSLIKDNAERKDVLLEICYILQTEGSIENTFVYLDKVFQGSTRETGAGRGLFRVLGKIGGNKVSTLAQEQLRKTPETLKPKALQNFIKGIAERGSYYEALQYMPEYISESKELSLYNEILKSEILKSENKTSKNAYMGNWNDASFYELSQNDNLD